MIETGTKVIKEGNPDCEHKWHRDSIVIDTLPPIYTKTCIVCGRVESYSYEEEKEGNENAQDSQSRMV